MRNWTIASLLLIVFSGFAFAQEETTNPSSTNDVTSGRLPDIVPLETLKLDDETKFNVYTNTPDNASESSVLYYLPVPFVIIDREKCYDPEDKTFTCVIKFPAFNKEISQRLTREDFRNLPCVQMDIKGYSVSLSVNNEKEVIKREYEPNGFIVIPGSLGCGPWPVKNDVIRQVLEKNPNQVNIDVQVFCAFKKMMGNDVRINIQRRFNQEIVEKVLGDKNSVLISRESLDNYLRDIDQDINTTLEQSYSIRIIGHIDQDMSDILKLYLKQNSSLFTEKNLEEYKDCKDSLIIYTPKFVFDEFKPDIFDYIINSDVTEKISKENFIKEWNHYKEAANKSDTIADFRKAVETDGSHKGGFNLDVFEVVKIGADTDTRFHRNSAFSDYTRQWEDLYSLLKDKDFNASDCYDRYYKKMEGEMKKFFTRPKEYKVIRIDRSQIDSFTNFYCQKCDIEIKYIPITLPVLIGEVHQNVDTNKRIQELETQVQNLEKTIQSKDARIKYLEDLKGVSH